MCISGFKSRPGPHPEFCWESFLIWSFFLADTTVAIFEFLKPQIQKKRILRSQTLNIFTIYFTVTEHTSFTKNFLEWIKTIRNGSKFTIGKYYINTMEMEIVISCKNVYACITFFLIYNFFYLWKASHCGSLVNARGYSRKPLTICNISLRREKTWMINVAESFHQVRWHKKTWLKIESYSKFLNFKICKCE